MNPPMDRPTSGERSPNGRDGRDGGASWVDLVSRPTESLERRAVAVLEPVCVAAWLSTEGQANLAELGITDRMAAYTGTRAAPMGAVVPAVVAAAFYNFRPDVIERATALAWSAASPGQILDAERDAADRALGPVAASLPAGDLAELAGLLRAAAERAAADTAGLPLAAAVAALPWADAAHLVVWQAHRLLREHRGDAHSAALRTAGLSGLEALVVDCARSGFPPERMRQGRFWGEEAWVAAADSLRQRGLLDAGEQLTDAGRQLRTEVEQRTDQVAGAAFAGLGAEGVERIVELGAPLGALAAPLALTKPRPQLSADGT